MLSFNKIVLHNFGSYEHAEIELNNRGFCLVTGKNNCKKDNALSNGSGKSLLWSAICYTLTGETIAGVKSNLKNVYTTDNEAYTKLTFTVDADEFEITRILAPKTGLIIIKNGVDVSGKTFKDTDKKLKDLLPDLDRNLIGSCLILGQGMPNRFSAFSPSDRKALLEKLTKCDFMIEDVKIRIAARQEFLNKQLRDYEDNLLVNNAQLNTLAISLKRVTDELNSLHKPDYAKLKLDLTNDILIADDLLKEATAEIDTITVKLADVDKLISAADAEKASLEKQLLASYYSAKRPVEQSLTEAQFELRTVDAEIKKIASITDVCPTCGQKLAGVHKPDTKPLEEKRTTLTSKVTEATKSLAAQKQKYDEYVAKIKADYSEKVATSSETATKLRADLVTAKTKFTKAQTTKSAKEADLAKLTYEEAAWDKHVAKLTTDKQTTEAQIADLTNLVNLATVGKEDISKRLAVVKKIFTLTTRDFRGYLLANIISYLDNKAKEYSMTVFGTNELSLYIDGNNLDISYCNKMFDNLSGGEKQRVDLILQFAVRSMLTAYLNFSSNMLVLDEITDFLDKKSCKAVMNLIEQELNTVESVFIVSHHADELELPIDSELKITKNSDGISTVTV